MRSSTEAHLSTVVEQTHTSERGKNWIRSEEIPPPLLYPGTAAGISQRGAAADEPSGNWGLT